MVSTTRTHRTQQERREQTREALLDATITCLVELGYARTTVQEICARAGVSRGAQQHHFTTKTELMTAALEHLFDRLIAEVVSGAAVLAPGRERLIKGIDMLWAAYSGTLSTAAVELWVAARTDPELREALLPVDRALGHATLEALRAAAEGESPESTGQAETMLLLTINLVRGLALDAMIGGDPKRRARLLEEWKAAALQRYLGE
ncbi:DNA-binding transcriptional regulator, AcrR family [Actinokineospora alba]|uniref:DNA-binding transcriptional regulator, AcrR family n=1 Tax=Actinokineospora alba TaxID=504798 RepID=A0A1H0N2A6_9PSEU|nr:TetR/AcrR family transcriptional regulator [Actinokineospora alba]TDP68528.1 TetR family transcriptional regulator [Actinokineospora alba]SDH81009.1 DNA-binding transcriptional regulator, AcrR family [Actinokineospora alba]SDO86665.1 DNA-binding transcriptional regulator, AcrR family [Actinokineospora alba]